jgi:deoxynucleoside triphosphate triphosphohydrolase SAMHD1
MFDYSQRLAHWANALRSDVAWTSALEAAFDKVGFDQDYISSLDDARRKYNRIKAIKDHLWGMIEIEPQDAWLLDSPLFQRTRRVRQTGLTYFTYPNANHSRFEHSLGVYFVVKRLLATFRRTEEAFDIAKQQRPYHDVRFAPVAYARRSREERLILHAALLHDLGHAVFSHVSEKLFSANPHLKMGSKTVLQFRQDFQARYDLVESDIQTGRGKALAELFSVAIITSSRFEKFYRRLPGQTEEVTLSDLCDISALILGDRIEPNDFALPELLSGPVDADKIDYMLRDAQACGISIGVDVARVFVRAGIYQCSVGSVGSLQLKGYDSHSPVKVFVIEQAGTDAIRELGIARLSLYERVYYHQLTRGAQAAFNDVILKSAASLDPDINKFGNFLTLWSLPEDVVLTELASCPHPVISSIAKSLATRRLPKRAACIGREFLEAPEAAVDVVRDALQDAYELRLQVFSSAVLAQFEKKVGEELLVALRQECSRIRAILGDCPPIDVALPLSDFPEICRLLPYPRQHDSAPPPALVIRGDDVERFGDRYFSYLYAGETPSQIAYLLASEGWREIALLAFQKLLCKRYSESFQVTVPGNTLDDASVLDDSSMTAKLELDGLFRPWLNVEASGRRCKVQNEHVNAILSSLVQAGYYNDIPHLYPQKINSTIESIANRFSEFEGERGWRIKPRHVASFISQFPPELRADLIRVLADENKFLFLNREQTINLVLMALSLLELETPIRLVPFSPSSGQFVRSHIRSALPSTGITVHSTLSHALNTAKKEGGSIVFADDNIASGTQSSEQIGIYMGANASSPQGNYVLQPLSDEEKAIFVSKNVGAVLN